MGKCYSCKTETSRKVAFESFLCKKCHDYNAFLNEKKRVEYVIVRDVWLKTVEGGKE
jgi:ribosomal protein L37AE/L43A